MPYGNEVTLIKRSKRMKFKYRCLYCTPPFEFEMFAGTTGGGVDSIGNRINRISNQIVCPQCGNFLPTFEGE